MTSTEIEELFGKLGKEEFWQCLMQYVTTNDRSYHYEIIRKNLNPKYLDYRTMKRNDYVHRGQIGNLVFHYVLNKALPVSILKKMFVGKYQQYGDMYFHRKPFEFSFMQAEFKWAEDIITNWDNYSEFYHKLHDTKSKETLICVILARILGKESYYAKCQNREYPQYFDKEIFEVSEQEVFVDGGAFIGDTAIEINRSFTSQCKIYSYELDSRNAEEAYANWKKENICNAELRLKGLSNENKRVSIISNGNSSHINDISDDSSLMAELVKLDDDLNENVTFIKLDIEGAEKNALCGMIQHIKKTHPKLAICIYHLPDDIWAIPQLILSIDESYQFSIRHYTDMEWETVLYAV